jgi:hypothetical protein
VLVDVLVVWDDVDDVLGVVLGVGDVVFVLPGVIDCD